MKIIEMAKTFGKGVTVKKALIGGAVVLGLGLVAVLAKPSDEQTEAEMLEVISDEESTEDSNEESQEV